MDRSRWSEINRIFHAALDVDPAVRRSFVAAESRGDAQLQAEVDQLLAADEEAGEYLEAPLVPAGAFPLPESPLAAGDLLCGRFRIVREIAEGGMGHVFEAFDNELAVPIALKVIRPEIAANPEVAARFRQEVRLARSITHPNICRTFDLEREGRIVNGIKTDLVFLTMEFLSGETLSARIERAGPVPFAEALAIARQVAAALHAAHALGIVHRDMKPSNIMLVGSAGAGPGERAVVTDFGLARLEPVLSAPQADASSLTRAGGPIGTLAYMAPEQLESAPVSPATDIYAFGLVLFEMVSGKRAFPSGNLLSGIAQRMRGSLSLEQQLSSETPPGWRTAIRACLQVQPEDRPQDALDVLRMIEDDRAVEPPKSPRLALFAGWMRRRLLAFAAAILVGVALLWGGMRLHEWRAQSQVASGALVYLAQVQNQTGERSFDNLTELIRAGLSQSIQVNLLDQSRVGDILQQMTRSPEAPIDPATAREVAWRAGAVRVIFVTITGSHGAYAMNVDIQQPDATPARYREHWPRQFRWSEPARSDDSNVLSPDLLTQIRASTDWIRNRAGESANDIARLDVPPEDATTGNWRALQDYTYAETLLAKRHISEAVTALQSATALDPNFSLAYARLGDVLLSINHPVEGFQAYDKALSPVNQQRLTRRELDRIRGFYALDTWDYATAEAQFRDLTVYYENDYLGWFYRANPLMRLGHPAEAVEALKRSFALRPSRVNTAASIAVFALIAKDRQTADYWTKYLRDAGADEATWIEGESSFLDNRLPEARRAFEEMRQSRQKPIRSMSYVLLAHLKAETGSWQEAMATLSDGIRASEPDGDSASQSQMLLDRAFLECRQRQFPSCLLDVNAALALNDGPKMVLASSSLLGSSLAGSPAPFAQRMRDLLRANQHRVDENHPGALFQMASLQTRAELLLADGDCNGALRLFHAEDVLDSPIGTREYLGRALETCASRQIDSTRAAAMRTQAEEAYARGAFQPALIWFEVTYHPPGFYADELTSWLRLATQEHADARVPQALSQLRALRPAEASVFDLPQPHRPRNADGMTPTIHQ